MGLSKASASGGCIAPCKRWRLITATGHLYYGDNLEVMRNRIPKECVDMIYLDPPFNSKTDYNILFKDGNDKAQVKAFEDKWTFNGTAHEAYADLMGTCISDTVQGLQKILGDIGTMAYLCIMAIRLLEMHRILKDSGSIFLHCDPTASHYLKVVMDSIFGTKNFRNEFVWKRTPVRGAGFHKVRSTHDVVLYYTKSNNAIFNRVTIPYDAEYVNKFYKYSDEYGAYRSMSLVAAGPRSGYSGKPWRGVSPHTGNHWSCPGTFPDHVTKPQNWGAMTTQEKLDYFDENDLILWPEKTDGVPQFKRYLSSGGQYVTDIITDIAPLSAQSAEYMGYQTQKPRALIERFVEMTTQPGDLVMDPFCGCGTTVEAAAVLDRQFIGIDASVYATDLVKRRIKQSYGIGVEIEGLPYTMEQAEELGATDGQEFQKWAISKMRGFHPSERMSGDGGVDGSAKVFFGGDYHTVVVSVKGGRNLNPGMLRELIGTVRNKNAMFGVLVTVRRPPKKWYADAKSEGVVGDGIVEYPRIQIYTVQDIFDEKNLNIPPLQPQIPSDARPKPRRGLQKRL